MSAFEFSRVAIDTEHYRSILEDPAAGAFVCFDGRVRNHSEGREVYRLDYEAYEQLGGKEGQRIVDEALAAFPVTRAHCVHRLGTLGIGDMAVWVGVSAAHRGDAFAACRYIIDEVKRRVPIWKKEYYADGDSGWVNCDVGSSAGSSADGQPGAAPLVQGGSATG